MTSYSILQVLAVFLLPLLHKGKTLFDDMSEPSVMIHLRCKCQYRHFVSTQSKAVQGMRLSVHSNEREAVLVFIEAVKLVGGFVNTSAEIIKPILIVCHDYSTLSVASSVTFISINCELT